MSSEAAEAVAAMIRSRQEEREAAHARKQEAAERLAEFRTEHERRRTYGLVKRHAAKLARRLEQGRLI